MLFVELLSWFTVNLNMSYVKTPLPKPNKLTSDDIRRIDSPSYVVTLQDIVDVNAWVETGDETERLRLLRGVVAWSPKDSKSFKYATIWRGWAQAESYLIGLSANEVSELCDYSRFLKGTINRGGSTLILADSRLVSGKLADKWSEILPLSKAKEPMSWTLRSVILAINTPKNFDDLKLLIELDAVAEPCKVLAREYGLKVQDTWKLNYASTGKIVSKLGMNLEGVDNKMAFKIMNGVVKDIAAIIATEPQLESWLFEDMKRLGACSSRLRGDKSQTYFKVLAERPEEWLMLKVEGGAPFCTKDELQYICNLGFDIEKLDGRFLKKLGVTKEELMFKRDKHLESQILSVRPLWGVGSKVFETEEEAKVYLSKYKGKARNGIEI